MTPTARPTSAERVRTACAHANQAMLAIPGHEPISTSFTHLRLGGDVIIGAPAGSAGTSELARSGSAGLPAVLEFADHAPLRLRETVRSLVWLRGHAYAVPAQHAFEIADGVAADYPYPALLDIGHTTTLLQLRIESAVIADASGAEPACPDQIRLASPDPFWEVESHWLQHLDVDHADVVDQLALRHAPALRRGQVRPLAIDQYGITLRAESDDGDHDLRLPFSEPATDVEALSRAVRLLIGCPFVNGLRSRR
jgi:hypothetical protein